MAGNPRENVEGWGFWDGGSKGHARWGEGSGRESGWPGRRIPTLEGLRVDLDEPGSRRTENVDWAESAEDEATKR